MKHIYLHVLYFIFFLLFLIGDPHTNHFYIGFWVLAGMFGFLTLEKIFAEENEDEKSLEEKDKSEGKVS